MKIVPVSFDTSGIYRDGGTYVTSFIDSNSCYCEVTLPVVVEVTDGKLTREGYASPNISVFSDTDELLHKKELLWEEAISIQKDLLKLIDADVAESEYEYATEMLFYLTLKGALKKKVM